MNRKVVIGLTGLGVVAAVGFFWPVQAPRLETPALGCTAPQPAFEFMQPAEINAPRVEFVTVFPQDVAAVFRQDRARKGVPIPPLTTTEGLNAYESEIAAALPHVPAHDRWKIGYFCPADANRDNRIDAQDIAFFMHVWSKGDSGLSRLIDENRDGELDEQDYNAFIDAYFNGNCSPEEFKAHRLRIC